MAVVTKAEIRQPLQNPQQGKGLNPRKSEMRRAIPYIGDFGEPTYMNKNVVDRFLTGTGDAVKSLVKEAAGKIADLFTLNSAKANIALTMKKKQDLTETKEYSPPSEHYGGKKRFSGGAYVGDFTDSTALAENKKELGEFYQGGDYEIPEGDKYLERFFKEEKYYKKATWSVWYELILQELSKRDFESKERIYVPSSSPGSGWDTSGGKTAEELKDDNEDELRNWIERDWQKNEGALGAYWLLDSTNYYRRDPTAVAFAPEIALPPGGEYSWYPIDAHPWRDASDPEDAKSINRASLVRFFDDAAYNPGNAGDEDYYKRQQKEMREATMRKTRRAAEISMDSGLPKDKRKIYSAWDADEDSWLKLSQSDLDELGTVVDPLPIMYEQPSAPYDPNNYFGARDRARSDSLGRPRVRSMSPIEAILHSGPDWMSNKFDCFFVFVPNGKLKPEEGFEGFDKVRIPEWATPYEKFLLGHKGFAVRLGSVGLPFMYNGDFSLPFLETQVNKIKSTKVLKTESQFSFRLDENLIWLDHVQNLAGRLNVLDDYVYGPKANSPNSHVKSAMAAGALGEGTMQPDAYRKLFRTIAASWSSGAIRAKKESTMPSAIRTYELCLIVKMQHLSSFINSHSQQKLLPYFVFENVKILGTPDAIKYESEPGQQEITVPFIFRRCYQVSPGMGNVKYDGDPASRPTWERTTNSVEPPEHKFQQEPRREPPAERQRRTSIPPYFTENMTLFWQSKGGPKDESGSDMAMVAATAGIKGKAV